MAQKAASRPPPHTSQQFLHASPLQLTQQWYKIAPYDQWAFGSDIEHTEYVRDNTAIHFALCLLIDIILESQASPNFNSSTFIERSKQEMAITIRPNDNDVLSGRGAWFNQHPGNEQFRRMLDEHKVSEPQLLIL